MKADILLRKDQINTQEDNKNIQMLKEDFMDKRTTTKITVIRRKKTTEDSELLQEITQRNMK